MTSLECVFCEQPIAPGEEEYLPCPPTRTPDAVCQECWVDHEPHEDPRLAQLMDWSYY